VRIVWMGGEPGMSVRIDRRSGGEWASLGTRSADGVGRIVLEDRDVAAGMWLEYRLAVVQDGVETYFGTANAAVPSWALDVSGVPLSGGITLRIQLPSGEPATVALFDLAGRRVWSREIGHLGAGLHEVRAEGAAVKSGVYFVRLTQAAVARSARVAVFE
jgi:hypothetical protein